MLSEKKNAKNSHEIEKSINIIFFDGYCVLCNGFVDWLIHFDKYHMLHFASLQGSTAKAFLTTDLVKNQDTVIFKSGNGSLSFKSEAVLNILHELGGIWKLFKLFKIIPIGIRDMIYDFIAEHRFKWFGKNISCRIPTESEREIILP